MYNVGPGEPPTGRGLGAREVAWNAYGEHTLSHGRTYIVEVLVNVSYTVGKCVL